VEAGTVSSERTISVTVNGTIYEREVQARKLLIHFIRTTSISPAATSAATPVTAARAR
jgi:hypothetical protein